MFLLHTGARQEFVMFFYIFCGLLLLNVFAAEAATHPSKSTGLLGRMKKHLAAAKEKFSKAFSPKFERVPTECFDQAPQECERLYEEGVCRYKEVAIEYCPTTCGLCIPQKRVSRREEYITSDDWEKIANDQQ